MGANGSESCYTHYERGGLASRRSRRNNTMLAIMPHRAAAQSTQQQPTPQQGGTRAVWHDPSRSLKIRMVQCQARPRWGKREEGALWTRIRPVINTAHAHQRSIEKQRSLVIWTRADTSSDSRHTHNRRKLCKVCICLIALIFRNNILLEVS